ncbi:ABC transporter permease [Streptomyces sp. HNM0574]|uniref:ABC transporter permease n=1 Tax=Streptomyces sp. HNM0574 TaxID=2714954 RepID=UPI00146E4CAB|nr:ABC transporter permease [Streptomyces sp. HNM0574]NLU68999.1 ABC transporter permease [Streptomyces sp. HNM0574]
MAEEQTDTASGAEAAAGAERRTVGQTVRTLASTLWFPAFFFTGFLVCYLLPFHNPTPHHVEVAVTAPAAAELQQALDAKSPGAFDIEEVPSAEAARDAVTDREASAAYVPGPGAHDLYVAKADGYSLESVLQKTFTSVAQQSGAKIQMHDLAPTAPGDGMGTGLFYLVLACTIPSYVMVMMLLRATNFSRRDKTVTLVAAGAVISCVAYLVGLAMDVVPNEPLAILFLFLMTQAVALTSYGLVPFCKQFFPGVAMGLFVLLSMPSSGGAIPVQMVPGFFRALHPVMPMGNLIEALRGLFYFDGVDVVRHVLVLCAWVCVGVVLLALGAWRERRAAAREEAGELAEPPVEDPTFELPEPSAVRPHGHRLGQGDPSLTGRVTGADGEPLSGVAITVTGTQGSELVRAMTDANGEYAAAGLPDRFVNVIASAPDRLAAVSRVRVREGHPVRQDFRLDPRASRARTTAGA